MLYRTRVKWQLGPPPVFDYPERTNQRLGLLCRLLTFIFGNSDTLGDIFPDGSFEGLRHLRFSLLLILRQLALSDFPLLYEICLLFPDFQDSERQIIKLKPIAVAKAKRG